MDQKAREVIKRIIDNAYPTGWPEIKLEPDEIDALNRLLEEDDE